MRPQLSFTLVFFVFSNEEKPICAAKIFHVIAAKQTQAQAAIEKHIGTVSLHCIHCTFGQLTDQSINRNAIAYKCLSILLLLSKCFISLNRLMINDDDGVDEWRYLRIY